MNEHICSSCGARYPDFWNSCPLCGTPAAQARPTAPDPNQTVIIPGRERIPRNEAQPMAPPETEAIVPPRPVVPPMTPAAPVWPSDAPARPVQPAQPQPVQPPVQPVQPIQPVQPVRPPVQPQPAQPVRPVAPPVETVLADPAPVSKKKSKAPLFIILAVLLVGIIVAVVFGVSYATKAGHYSSGEDYFQAGEFVLAHEEFLAAGNYQDAAEKADLALLAEHYRLGTVAFAAGDYKQAEEEFRAAGNYSDAAAQITLCQQAEHYRLGAAALEQEDFGTAIAEFTAANGYQDSAAQLEAAYRMEAYFGALDAMDSKDYVLALELLEKAGGYRDSTELIRECSYQRGMQLKQAGDYKGAITMLEAANGYGSSKKELADCATILGKGLLKDGKIKDALSYFKMADEAYVGSDELDNYIALCQAELCYSTGDLNGLVEWYDKIPTTFKPAEFNIAQRRTELKRYANFTALCGTWGSDRYDVTINQRDGGWVRTYYYPAGTLTDMELKLSCTLNADGTVNIKGEATIYYFNTFPLGSFYTDKTMTVKFEVKNQNYLPSSYKVDDHTRVYFTGGFVRVVYQNSVDSGTASTTSDVSFNTRK